MDELGFYVPSTVFQSFRDDGRVNMKGNEAPFRFGKNLASNGIRHGYLNTVPLKDQHKTFHESRVDVALLITEVRCWSSHGLNLKLWKK